MTEELNKTSGKSPETTDQLPQAERTTLSPDKHSEIISATWSGPASQTKSQDTGSEPAALQSPTPGANELSEAPSFFSNNKAATDKKSDTSDKTSQTQPADNHTDISKQAPDARELAEMKKLIDESRSKLEIHTAAQDKQKHIVPDIIIDKNGVAHLNPDKKQRNADEPLVAEVETQDTSAMESAVAADTIQKATVRDLIGYFQMQHPDAAIPDDWLAVLSHSPDLPPVRHVSSGGGGGGGFRGGEGGGFSGGSGGHPGAISHHVPREVPRGAHVGHTTTLENRLAPQLKDSLDLHKFVDRVVAAVSRNEGHFTSINPNDAGYGISVGIRQWNQKAGELPTLLKAWHDKDPEKFNSIFGANASHLLNDSWVRHANFQSQPGLMDGMKKALADKEFQDVQVELSREFVVRGIQLGLKYGFKSELGLAHVVDIANQKGFGGAESALRAIGGAGSDEKEAVHRLENAAHRPGGHNRLAQLERLFDPFKKMLDV
jgi:hypothetical protein